MNAVLALTASTGTTTMVLVTVLVAMGVAMIGVTLWLVRATRSDAPALGPLEVMGERRWLRADADGRRAALSNARPPGAAPPAPMVPIEDKAPPAEFPPVPPSPAAVPVRAFAPPEQVTAEPVGLDEAERSD